MSDIAKLVAELTLDEKAALTAGVDLWSTAAVPRLGIPSVRFPPDQCAHLFHEVGVPGGAERRPARHAGGRRARRAPPGAELHVGRSTAAIDHVLTLEITE
jgi:hypothetical protein